MDVVCLNFSKAFDVFVHDILVSKLGSYSLQRQTIS